MAPKDTFVLKEGRAPVRDRLVTTLFLFALLHGIVIMGVSFTSGAVTEGGGAPTLEVLLVPDNALPSRPNDKADYLAQRDQQGSGNLRERERPTTPRSSPLPFNNPGFADGDSLELHRAGSNEGKEELIASHGKAPRVRYLESPAIVPDAPSRTPLLMTAERQSALPAANEGDRLALHGRNERELIVTPNTRQSNVAVYLDGWRHKVERIGTLNFPMQTLRQKTTGNPELEVSVRSDGQLGDVLLRHSSGSREVDQAAMAILKLAAPYDPFPRELADLSDSIRFSYEWQFLDGKLVDTAVRAPTP